MNEIDKSLRFFFNIEGQLGYRNHINDRCTEYTESEMFGRCTQIDLSHKSQNGPVQYPKMQH